MASARMAKTTAAKISLAAIRVRVCAMPRSALLQRVQCRRADDRSAVRDERLRPHRRRVEYGGRERPAKAGGGVEVEAVAPEFGQASLDRRMAVHDVLAMLAGIVEEQSADPEHGFLVLRRQR